MTAVVNKDLFDLAANLVKCQILDIKQMWQKQQQWVKTGDSDTNKPHKGVNIYPPFSVPSKLLPVCDDYGWYTNTTDGLCG